MVSQVKNKPEVSKLHIDYAAHERAIREESKQLGKVEGLILLTIKKLKKGKTVSQIADDLEESPDKIRKLCEDISSFAPDYDMEQIQNFLTEKYNKNND